MNADESVAGVTKTNTQTATATTTAAAARTVHARDPPARQIGANVVVTKSDTNPHAPRTATPATAATARGHPALTKTQTVNAAAAIVTRSTTGTAIEIETVDARTAIVHDPQAATTSPSASRYHAAVAAAATTDARKTMPQPTPTTSGSRSKAHDPQPSKRPHQVQSVIRDARALRRNQRNRLRQARRH